MSMDPSHDDAISEYETLYVVVLFRKALHTFDDVHSTTISMFLIAVSGDSHLVLVAVRIADLSFSFLSL